jgi:hypothetical protein
VYIQPRNSNRISSHLYIQNRNPNRINKSVVYTGDTPNNPQAGDATRTGDLHQADGKQLSVYIQINNLNRINSGLYIQNRNPNRINKTGVYTRGCHP